MATFLKKRENYILVVSVILMTAALFARDLFGIGIGRTIFIVLAVIPSLIMSYQSLVYYIFFLFSLTSGLPVKYIFPILIFLLLFKNKNSFNVNGFKCFVVLVYLELLHYMTYSFHISLPSVVGYFSDLFFLFYFITLKEGLVDVKKCIIYFCVGLAVFLFAIFYITQINGSVEMLLEESGRIGSTKQISDVEEGTMMLNANPNGLGFFAIVGLSSIIVLYIRKYLSFFVMTLLAILYVSVGALGVSRTFLLCLVVLVIMFGLFARGGEGKTSYARYFLFFIIIMTLAYILMNTSYLYNAYNYRMTNESLETMNGRTTTLFLYNDWLLDHPLYLIFGTGAVYYGQVVHAGIAVHNGLQQILVSYGLIGIFFFIFITVRAIKRCYKKGNPVCLIPFAMAFIFKQSGQLLYPSFNLYLFITAFFVMMLSKHMVADNRN